MYLENESLKEEQRLGTYSFSQPRRNFNGTWYWEASTCTCFFFSAHACEETGLLLFPVYCLFHLLRDVCVGNMTLLAHGLFMVFLSTCISLSPFFLSSWFSLFWVFFFNLCGTLVSDALSFWLGKLLLACNVVNNEFIFVYFFEVLFYKAFSFLDRIE